MRTSGGNSESSSALQLSLTEMLASPSPCMWRSTAPGPPTSRSTMSVAVLSLTIVISVSRSWTVGLTPASK